MACHCMEGSKKIIIRRKLNTACSTIFKNKSIPAELELELRSAGCQTKMGISLLDLFHRSLHHDTQRALGRVLVSIVTHSK